MEVESKEKVFLERRAKDFDHWYLAPCSRKNAREKGLQAVLFLLKKAIDQKGEVSLYEASKLLGDKEPRQVAGILAKAIQVGWLVRKDSDRVLGLRDKNYILNPYLSKELMEYLKNL